MRFFKVLKNKNFFIFSFSQLFSQIGDKVNHFTFFAILKDLAPYSAIAFSFLGAVITLPNIIFSFFAGIIVDRFNRKVIMVISEILRSLFIFLIIFLGIKLSSLPLIYFFIFFLFLSTLFSNISKISSIPEFLKSKEEILTANSFNNFIVRISSLIGIIFSGIIIELGVWKKFGFKGYDVVLFLNSFLFLFSALILSFLKIKGIKKQNKREFIKDLKEALKIAKGNKKVLFVYFSIIPLVFTGSTIYVLLSVYLQQILGFGTKGLGFIGGITSFGMIFSAFLFGNYGKKLNKVKIIGYSFILIGILIFSFSFFQKFQFLLLISFLGGFFLAPIMISQDTIIHEEVETSYRGRIFSFREFFVNLLFIIFSLLNGIFSKIFTIKGALILSPIFLLFLNLFSLLIYTFKNEKSNYC